MVGCLPPDVETVYQASGRISRSIDSNGFLFTTQSASYSMLRFEAPPLSFQPEVTKAF